MLAFSFGIVSERFDAQKALVREEAVAIRAAWKRSNFLPEADRAEASALLRQYVDARVKFTETDRHQTERVKRFLTKTSGCETALEHGGRQSRKDMNSNVAASVQRLFEHSERNPCVASGARD